MPNRNADGGQTPLTGRVNFTMMYVAHDAFTRDRGPRLRITGPELDDLAHQAAAAGLGDAATDAGRGRPGGIASRPWGGDRRWNT